MVIEYHDLLIWYGDLIIQYNDKQQCRYQEKMERGKDGEAEGDKRIGEKRR